MKLEFRKNKRCNGFTIWYTYDTIQNNPKEKEENNLKNKFTQNWTSTRINYQIYTLQIASRHIIRTNLAGALKNKDTSIHGHGYSIVICQALAIHVTIAGHWNKTMFEILWQSRILLSSGKRHCVAQQNTTNVLGETDALIFTVDSSWRQSQ